MSSDLVDRLRASAGEDYTLTRGPIVKHQLLKAADEIERLRLELRPPRRVQIREHRYVLVTEIAEVCYVSGHVWVSLSGHPDGEERKVALEYAGRVYDALNLARPEALID